VLPVLALRVCESRQVAIAKAPDDVNLRRQCVWIELFLVRHGREAVGVVCPTMQQSRAGKPDLERR
jgi:hypothetical protein